MMSYLMYLSVKCNDKFDLMSSMYFILLFALAWSLHLLHALRSESYTLLFLVLPSCFISHNSHSSLCFIFHIHPPLILCDVALPHCCSIRVTCFMFVSCSLPEFIPVISVLFHDLRRLSLMWPGKGCHTILLSIPCTCLCAWLTFLSCCPLMTLNAKLVQCK